MTILHTIVILFLLDVVYLNTKIVDYEKTVVKIQGHNMSKKWFGLMAYVIMAYTIVFIAKTPQESAVLGFVIYSIFNLTNFYMFKDWDIYTATSDTLWGTFLFYLTKTII